MAFESLPAYAGFRSGPAGQAYNEAAFRYFLAVDRRRAERAKRSLVLVLVNVRQNSRPSAPLTHSTASALFSALGACVREIDFVGWYREGRVAAAVLAQGVNASDGVRHRTAERVIRALGQCFPADQLRNLRVRVVQLGVRARN